MLRLVCAALFALALVVMPASMSTQYADQARAEATTKGEKAAEKAAPRRLRGEEGAQEARADREAEGGRARQKQCGAEYQDAKKSGKLRRARPGGRSIATA